MGFCDTLSRGREPNLSLRVSPIRERLFGRIAGLLACGAWLTLAAAPVTPLVSRPFSLTPYVDVGGQFMAVRLLGAVEIPRGRIGTEALHSLSGLAWDDDEALLYAISDRGSLFHIRPSFSGSHLIGAEVVAAHRLRPASAGNRKRRTGSWDTEGLTIRRARNGKRDDATLIVSFERRPRVEEFSRDGRQLGALAIPKAYRSADAFEDSNRALEAVTVHREHGLLRGYAKTTIRL